MKILVIRVGRAGDIVMVTPALKAILEKWSDAELHILTSPDGRRILQGYHERLSKQIIYQRKGIKGVWEKYRIRRELNKIIYDKVFCFELNPSFKRLISQKEVEFIQITHELSVTNYAKRCLRVICEESEIHNKWLSLPVTEEGRNLAFQELSEQGITENDYVVGLHPSFSALRKFLFRNRNTRRQKEWPAENFASLVKLLVEHGKTSASRIIVIMDLVPEDRDLGERIVELSGGKVRLFIPPLNFERYKAVLQRMDLLVSPDTGPMHIAAAVGTNLVALFAGHDPRDCGPYVPDSQYRILRAEDTEHSEQGLGAITPESVFQACKTFLP